SVGVVAELRLGTVFHHPNQVAFGVPFQFLVVVGGEAAGHVARLVVAVLFQLGAGGAGLLDLGESVRLGLSGCGVGVGADGVAAGGVLGFTQTVAHRVVGIGVPVGCRATEAVDVGCGPARGGVMGAGGPGFDEATQVVVGEALCVAGQSGAGGGVADAQDVACVVVGVVLLQQRPVANLVHHAGRGHTVGGDVERPGDPGLVCIAACCERPLQQVAGLGVDGLRDVGAAPLDRGGHAQFVVAEDHRFGTELACRGEGHAFEGAVGVVGVDVSVVSGQRAFGGGDGDHLGERPVHLVVGQNRGGVGVAVDVAGGRGELSLGFGVVDPLGAPGALRGVVEQSGL